MVMMTYLYACLPDKWQCRLACQTNGNVGWGGGPSRLLSQRDRVVRCIRFFCRAYGRKALRPHTHPQKKNGCHCHHLSLTRSACRASSLRDYAMDHHIILNHQFTLCFLAWYYYFKYNRSYENHDFICINI